MALLGGGVGGAGNPVGGSFTGPAQAIDIYGDFAAAYSGIIDIDNNETTLIEYTSGNYLLVGEWQGYYYESVYGEDFRWVVYLNGQKVESYTAEGSIRGNSRSQLNLIIPSYTEVKITGQNVSDSTAREMMASITGRIYKSTRE